MSSQARTPAAARVALRYSLPPAVAPRTHAPGRTRVREQRARAAELLRAALQAAGPELAASPANLAPLPLRTDASGAPLPVGDLHWSKADSRGAVLVAAASAPVGVDVERFGRPRLNALSERFGAEAAAVTGRSDEAALLAGWCAREAVLKLHGLGLAGLGRTRWLALAPIDAPPHRPGSSSAAPRDAVATLAFDHHIHRVRLARRGAYLFAVACDACDPEQLDFHPAPAHQAP